MVTFLQARQAVCNGRWRFSHRCSTNTANIHQLWLSPWITLGAEASPLDFFSGCVHKFTYIYTHTHSYADERIKTFLYLDRLTSCSRFRKWNPLQSLRACNEDWQGAAAALANMEAQGAVLPFWKPCYRWNHGWISWSFWWQTVCIKKC